MPTSKSITLNEQESRIRDFLVGAAELYGRSNGRSPVLRFAGGWVRDKLLGGESKDIDVAIDSMSGKDFYFALQEYQRGLETSDANLNSLGRLAEIKKDAEKSKHLETATTKLFGLELDLVNLRTESYNEDSRNPEIRVGTPEEDAFRRDATINSMFYNLNTLQVEDFTGRGLEDLERGMIRTPLEAEQTFRDDPLRMLRLIRFSCRFGFEIDERALHWMKDESIQDALERKISRERILIELEKTLEGPRPADALEYIVDMGLYNTIFTIPGEAGGAAVPRVDASIIQKPIRELRRLTDDLTPVESSLADLLAPEPTRWKCWLLCALLPWLGQAVPETLNRKGAPTAMATRVARDGLKIDNDTMKMISLVSTSFGLVREQWRAIMEEKESPSASPTKRKREAVDRVTLGMSIRRWGPDWRFVVVAAYLMDIAEATGPETIQSSREGCTRWLDMVQRENLAEVWNPKSAEGAPILNGSEIFNIVKKVNAAVNKGPWMTDAVNVVAEYRLREAQGATKEGATEAVLEAINGGRVVLV